MSNVINFERGKRIICSENHYCIFSFLFLFKPTLFLSTGLSRERRGMPGPDSRRERFVEFSHFLLFLALWWLNNAEFRRDSYARFYLYICFFLLKFDRESRLSIIAKQWRHVLIVRYNGRRVERTPDIHSATGCCNAEKAT